MSLLATSTNDVISIDSYTIYNTFPSLIAILRSYVELGQTMIAKRLRNPDRNIYPVVIYVDTN